MTASDPRRSAATVRPGPDTAALRARLEDSARADAERFFAGVPARTLVRDRAAAVDVALTELWDDSPLAERPSMALLAVGGYGRGELHPYSDIDLQILSETRPDRATTAAIERFVTLLWDLGLDVGHSVRTLDDCARAARSDLTVITNLLESRLLRGPSWLLGRMRERIAPREMWPVAEFFAAKHAEQVERHHKYHDTAYNLEPNVKEGPGGLRDIQTIGWVAKRHFAAVTLRELVDHDFLTPGEHRSLAEGQSFLWDVRYALHLAAGRREDRLLFDYQRGLAERFGYRDDRQHLAVEHFMKRYFRTVQELGRLNEMLLELFQEAILHDASEPAAIERVGRRFRAVNGFLETASPDTFRTHRFALLELFLVLQQHPELEGVRASTIRQIRDHRHLITDAFREDIRARGLFLEILRQPRGITHALRRMHRYGVLGAYLPAFGRVVGQMQYDLFHTYTVDEHTLFVVRNLRRFATPEHRDEFPLCSHIIAHLPKPELVYIAGLYHDLAKGSGRDHSEAGADLAREFCEQHGLGAYDTRLVSWLVRHHLLMSVTAQRRDISDPDIVAEFARTVGDQVHLDYLYVLTVADIRATNPRLWNDWKDTLLRDLYESASRALRRGLERPVDRGELIIETKTEARALLARGEHDATRARALWNRLGDDYFIRHTAEEIAWHTRAVLAHRGDDPNLVLVRRGRGGTEVFVYAPDQEFLFAATASLLERLGLTVRDARIITSADGTTLDTWVVDDMRGAVVDSRRRREIRQTLSRKLRNPAAVQREVGRTAPRALKHFATATRVEVRDDSRSRRTVIEVFAQDRPGLLARIGWALADRNVRLHDAKIATFGERAEDVFQVSETRGAPLAAARREALARALTEALS